MDALKKKKNGNTVANATKTMYLNMQMSIE